MKPYTPYAAVPAALRQRNVDTDAIIPSAWLRSPRADLARGLFARWRFDGEGREKPDFVLNRLPYRDASMLIAGENFGCGSSREAAVWALLRFGIRCVVAPSFADIFYENSFRNGLLPAVATPEETERLMALAETGQGRIEVDLARSVLRLQDGSEVGFSVPDVRKEALLEGRDQIDDTLRHLPEIEAFEARYRNQHPQANRAIEGGTL